MNVVTIAIGDLFDFEGQTPPANLQRATRLRQSIRQKSFTGKSVPETNL